MDTPLERSVIGTGAKIEALSPDTAAAFHAAYDAATAVLILAGDVGWKAAGDVAGQGTGAPW